jgi:Do/DeqQ family serine protease
MVNGEELPSLAPLVERVSPAVVNIRVSQTVTTGGHFGDEAFRRFFGLPDMPGGGQREVASAGSGVIVDADNGYILTNHHVVDQADQIQISTIDGEVFDAEIVGSDAATDIAVIKVDASGLTDMPIGDSERVRVGDFVLAIGNPFGLGHTVTSGIVSALGRSGISRDGYEDFIQTDASINPGNSGGALVNLRGELVGINSAIISRTGGNVGIGFAVPTEIASSIMRQILDFGEVRRGLLGVSIADVNAEVAEALSSSVTSGALITRVEPGSAAEDAGLEVDDIIVGVNEKKIAGAVDFHGPGSAACHGQRRRGNSSRARRRTVCRGIGRARRRRGGDGGRTGKSRGTTRLTCRRYHYGDQPAARAFPGRAQRDCVEQPYPVPARAARRSCLDAADSLIAGERRDSGTGAPNSAPVFLLL